MLNAISKYQVATAVAILFHVIGLTGILFFDREFFIRTTPVNLLLMLGLLVWTQAEKNLHFLLFFLGCFGVGIGVEIIGVNSGLLFGDYKYGNVLGPGLNGVPYIIGINWFIIIYCCGIAIHTLLTRLLNRVAADTGSKPRVMKALSVIVDAATLAVFFDWVMEPVAVKLGFWQWLGNGEIPFFNYACWFVLSGLLLALFHTLTFSKSNKFAINLLLIQLMFFLLLRTFL